MLNYLSTSFQNAYYGACFKRNNLNMYLILFSSSMLRIIANCHAKISNLHMLKYLVRTSASVNGFLILASTQLSSSHFISENFIVVYYLIYLY